MEKLCVCIVLLFMNKVVGVDFFAVLKLLLEGNVLTNPRTTDDILV